MVRQDKSINWITSIFMVLFHIGAVAALFMFSWKALFVGLFLYWIAGSFGIGLGYHRLLTHRGFKCPKWFEYFLTSLRDAGAGRRADFLGGHAPRASSAHRQAGRSAQPARWRLLGAHGLDHERRILHNKLQELLPYVPDLRKDKFHVWISEWHWVPMVVRRPDCFGHRRLEVMFCGASSCAPCSSCTAPGS